MTLSKRANLARKRYAKWQRWVDWAMRGWIAVIITLAVLGIGRLLGAW